jgi:ribosomal protein S12
MFNKKLSKPKVLFLKKIGFFRKNLYLSRILYSNPQKKATVNKVRITTPRKPNSARRKTIKSFFRFNRFSNLNHTIKKITIEIDNSFRN